MEREKEVRYRIDNSMKDLIIKNSEPYKLSTHTLDITFGAFGFESLAKTGRITRIRQKGETILLEIKARESQNSWIEEKIKLDSVEQGFNFLKLSGLEPYLFLDRDREVRKYKNLKIFLDNFSLLGDFVEIEYQDGNRADAEEFISLCGIKGESQPLYGDIVKELFLKDKNFKESFETTLNKIVNY